LKTVVLLKPDCLERDIVGTTISQFEAHGLKLSRMKMVSPPRELLELHYEEHKLREFFERLISSMEGKPLIACSFTGKSAVTKGRKVASSVRERFLNGAAIGPRNLVHSSDSEASATREYRLWFLETP